MVAATEDRPVTTVIIDTVVLEIVVVVVVGPHLVTILGEEDLAVGLVGRLHRRLIFQPILAPLRHHLALADLHLPFRPWGGLVQCLHPRVQRVARCRLHHHQAPFLLRLTWPHQERLFILLLKCLQEEEDLFRRLRPSKVENFDFLSFRRALLRNGIGVAKVSFICEEIVAHYICAFGL